jgi:hypothetical protein
MTRHRHEGVLVPPEKEGDVTLFVHSVRHPFEVGDVVMDITAEENEWPDVRGKVVEVDGSNIKVRYESGTERWKMHINLRKEKD